MELKEFIATGVIESYLLGTASKQEIDMMHSMLAKYPSLQIEIDAVEEALLRVAESNAPYVDEKIKDKILASLEFNKPKPSETNQEPVKMVPMPVSNKRLTMRYGLVASIGLLIVSTVLNVVLFNSNRKMVSQVNTMGTQSIEMQRQLTDYMQTVNKMTKDFAVLTQNSSIPLKGTDVSPKSLATVYFNDQTKEVYLYVNDLPDPPTDMQYQLWAIVDGKPVNAGVFDTGKQSSLHAMLKPDGTPQAFAVTLEKRGGNPTPTMEAMFLLGEV